MQGRKVLAPDGTPMMAPYKVPEWEDTSQRQFLILSSLRGGLRGLPGGPLGARAWRGFSSLVSVLVPW